MGEVEKLTLVVAVAELRLAVNSLYEGFADMFEAVKPEVTETMAEEAKSPLDQSIRDIEATTSDLYAFRSDLQLKVYRRITPDQPKKP